MANNQPPIDVPPLTQTPLARHFIGNFVEGTIICATCRGEVSRLPKRRGFDILSYPSEQPNGLNNHFMILRRLL
ncbi:hypothetical protein ACJIZ3_014423 [Penstemon smallii]|uniref:Uncharacterized protein n=1 Tax=Penstemon smallii TaxID=265156 RepID=A0ABD3RJJ0_9LAMI